MITKPKTQSKRGEEFNSDALEIMAWNLEQAQQARYRRTKFKHTFFDRETEKAIHEQIKLFRKQSKTFHPDNER